MIARFAELFDRLRDPGFKPDVFTELRIERLELGALWEFSVVSPNASIDWGRAIEAVAM